MKPIAFTKMEGTGNDFLLIDNRRGLLDQIKLDDLVRKACNRRFGIGADGVILLGSDQATDFFMRYFNSGGDEAAMCGNGARCIVRFAERLGLIKNKCSFRTHSGNHQAEIDGDLVRLKIDRARISELDKHVALVGRGYTGDFIDVGVPHYVVYAQDLEAIDLRKTGAELRHAVEFQPAGTNVNFVSVTPPGLRIRTYERGVENEVLACGTGAIAATLSAAQRDQVVSPASVFARGGRLNIYFKRGEQCGLIRQFSNIVLEGPASFVCDGLYWYQEPSAVPLIPLH